MNVSMLRRLAPIIVVAALAFAPAGCGRREEPGPARAESGAPIPVTVQPAGAAAARRSIVLPARVAAREEVTIRSTIAARLSELPYDEGQAFRSGAVLARFTAPETRAALEATRASLASSAVRLDLARKQEARIDSLYRQRVAALRELELARQEGEAAAAAHAGAEAAYEGLASGVLVRAPFDGIVVRHHLDPGTAVGPGEPVLDVRSWSAGDIVVAVPEGWAADLSHSTAHVRVGDGVWRPAVLRHADGMTDFTTRTRTARFRPAPGAGPALSAPGAGTASRGAPDAGDFAQVRLEWPEAAGRPAAGDLAAGASALTVPARAVIRRGSLTGVYVVREGRAWLRWIRLGRADPDRVEVLAGLAPGEDVVLEPEGLMDGAAVSPRP